MSIITPLLRPCVADHDGVRVVRDDMLPGGTKFRYLRPLFDQHDEIVYASPAEGGAQSALAVAAYDASTPDKPKRATIFTAKRNDPHDRAKMAKRAGANVCLVTGGYLNVVQGKAREYCDRTGAYLLPFGADLPDAHDAIAAAALASGEAPEEVWCTAGSGTLAKGLMKAWPGADFCLVQVGREVDRNSLKGLTKGSITIHVHKLPFGRTSRAACPFPSDPHYDRKAWEVCQAERDPEKRVLFWNVTGPADPAWHP